MIFAIIINYIFDGVFKIFIVSGVLRSTNSNIFSINYLIILNQGCMSYVYFLKNNVLHRIIFYILTLTNTSTRSYHSH